MQVMLRRSGASSNGQTAMPADGAAPQGIKARRNRDPSARLRIAWAVEQEIAANHGLTRKGFELLSRAEQMKRIRKWLAREGVPPSEMPTARQLRTFLEKHSQIDASAAAQNLK